MTYINKPVLTLLDIAVLEKVKFEDLDKMIEFLKDTKVIMWRNYDNGELVPENELPRNIKHQPLPEYPNELKRMGQYFSSIISDLGGVNFELLKDEGFFDKESLAAEMICTIFTPYLICTFIADSYRRDKFCDGLLGNGIYDNIYLKMILHLQDLKRYYEHIKAK